MKLEQIFISPCAQQRFRQGPLGTQLDGFCQWMVHRGYSLHTIRFHIPSVSHFSKYLEQCGVTDFKSFNPDHVKAFVTEYLPRSQCRRPGAYRNNHVAYSIHRFVQYLKCCGYLDDFRTFTPAYQTLLNEYREWMKRYCNTALTTLKLRTGHLTRFFDWLDSDSPLEKLSTLSPDEIQTFFLNYCKPRGYASRRSMQAALRTFLRFCFVRGYLKQELDGVVPTLRTYKLSGLPRGIEHEEAQKLLDTINRSTEAGRRDYAILQLLYTYGVRGGQVRALQLDDINWEQSQICFLAQKNGKESRLPLTEDVGNSLLDYLQYVRPKVPYPEVFITLRAPYGPLRHSSSLYEIVARHMRRGNIKSPTYGTHTFRHCFASRMLQKGHSLKFIADMIGHRSLQTTFIYTKVDFIKLKDVGLQWPGQER